MNCFILVINEWIFRFSEQVCLFHSESGKESRVRINGLLALPAYHNVSISQIYAPQISLKSASWKGWWWWWWLQFAAAVTFWHMSSRERRSLSNLRGHSAHFDHSATVPIVSLCLCQTQKLQFSPGQSLHCQTSWTILSLYRSWWYITSGIQGSLQYNLIWIPYMYLRILW